MSSADISRSIVSYIPGKVIKSFNVQKIRNTRSLRIYEVQISKTLLRMSEPRLSHKYKILQVFLRRRDYTSVRDLRR